MLDLPNGVETDQNKDQVNDWIDHTEVDHINVLFQVIDVSVEADVIQKDD